MKFFLRSRFLAAIILACCLWAFSGVGSPAALAVTQIKLSDLSYKECSPEVAEGAIAPGRAYMEANCFMITGKAVNTSGKPVVDADVYGRVYDANNNPVMENRTRLGSIDQVPPGTSDFELRISVAENLPTPLKLEQFKASGFSGKVRRDFLR